MQSIRKIIIVAVLLFVVFGSVTQVNAQATGCGGHSAWTYGVFLEVAPYNLCAASITSAVSSAVACPAGTGMSNICCMNGATPQCVSVDISQPLNLVTTKTKTAVADTTKYFTPNVPIPNLFGTTAIGGDLLAKYLGAFYVYFIGVIGILAVVMIMYGGYHYIVSMGNPSRMNQGKEIISGALIGLIIALASYLLLSIINPALVNIHSLVPTFISQITQTYEQSGVADKTVDTTIDISSLGITQAEKLIQANGYDKLVLKYANNDPALAYHGLAILIVESHANPNAQSHKKNGDPLAYGLMQVLPATAKQYGVDTTNTANLFNPEQNIKAGMGYLKALVDNPCPDSSSSHARSKNVVCSSGPICTRTDYQYYYAAYNGGMDANFCSTGCPTKTWWQCDKNSGYDQTRTYVKRVTAVYQWLKQNKYFG